MLEEAHTSLYDAYDQLHRCASNAIDTTYKAMENVHKKMAKLHEAKAELETKVNTLTKANAEVTEYKNQCRSLQNKLTTASGRLSKKREDIGKLQNVIKELKEGLNQAKRTAADQAKMDQQMMAHQMKMNQAEHSAQVKSHYKQLEQERKTQAKNDRYNQMHGMFNSGSAGPSVFSRGAFPGSNNQTMVCICCLCLKLKTSLFLIHCFCRKTMIAVSKTGVAVEAGVTLEAGVTVEAGVTIANAGVAAAEAATTAVAALITPNTSVPVRAAADIQATEVNARTIAHALKATTLTLQDPLPAIATASMMLICIAKMVTTMVTSILPVTSIVVPTIATRVEILMITMSLLLIMSIKSMRNTALQILTIMESAILWVQVLCMEHLHHNTMVIPRCRTPSSRISATVGQVCVVLL